LDKEALAQQTTMNGHNETVLNDTSNIFNSTLIIPTIATFGLIFTAIIGAILKHKSDLQIEIGKTLRQNRIKVYSKLFTYMHILAIIPNQGPGLQDYKDIESLQLNVTRWYYKEEGGLFMRYLCQEAYIDFQKTITKIIKDKKNISKDIENVKVMGYIFRLKLLEDVGIKVSKFIPINKWSRISLSYIFDKDFKRLTNYEEVVRSYYELFYSRDVDKIISILFSNGNHKK
jgi:hypothetical protein